MSAHDDPTVTGGHMLSDHRVVLSLGSNLGDRLDNLQEAIDALFDAPGLTLRRVSGVYETAPWGGIEQDDFLNIVVVATTRLAPMTLLDRVLSIEESMRRERVIRWGPRTLDIDIVFYEGVTSDDPVLSLPHPRAHERAFVLVPWAEVDPDAVLEPHGRVADLAAVITDQVVTLRDDLALQFPS
ncbi:2-amino-4-hydroxy-6-hydroxymethyldihydropteridine diphosphokinase [Actinocorallia sp. API 0066]|uniref:2-amino-4-hydroxy-6- hydroxymethyldihydropteridine diphosphokinase n=1 Tax=Actinocorallia sp. API 0066 TaxID=2896846 RepID=UPI001E3C8DF3|nr:2-amino-4-hydroxy-6-hydroxymethyldihydropteridine diphosphokinase [Actinocorallia sp. API 0066]MCD0452289.1 2-amino-4-hydroxy-6-hydroxymethyldihydropteridine diphosphokinase [Actinocorallia sp. API 0066]